MIIPLLYVSNNILQPLKKFMRLMGEVSLGEKKHLSKRITVDGYAEMIIMASRFNEMLAEIEKLTDHLLESKRVLYETELIKRRAELSFLQSQINPHFLYNTLESIKGLAVRQNSSQIFELTKALSLFFRYSIKGPDMISLEEELSIIKNYIFIHQIRFGNRLQVEYDIRTECLGCLVPKMILQPIVENAIKHGIEPLERTGLLVIKGNRHGENLHLSDTFKERIRRRPIIEHKNAELKRYHGMTRAKYRGLFRMRMQALLTAFVVNAKRMVKLIEQMQPAS
ncbi:histidine kinase [Paenibacillus sp. WST5]|uniref:Histidine kinase n=2 Tax=Paenibacillus sedimenti TaxID=2770274 RepID=A0A926KVP1_9BACL|nr:histidine kinase [Paenibacillus sedimenti]